MNINRLNFVNPANVTGLVTTKGDLITTTTGTGLTRLPMGTDGQILVAESTEPTGFEWIDQGSFTDAQFTIVGTNSNFIFDASNLTAERTLTISDKSGTVAMISDISGNSATTFNDDVFTVQNAANNSKKMMLDASGIATSTTRTFTVPDTNMTLIGQNNNALDPTSFGLSTTDNTYSRFSLHSAELKSRFMRFRVSGASGGGAGWSGIEWSWFGSDQWYMHTRNGGNLYISRQTNEPVDHHDLGNIVWSIDTTSGNMRLYNQWTSNFSQFAAGSITANRTLTMPDASTTLIGIGGEGTGDNALNSIALNLSGTVGDYKEVVFRAEDQIDKFMRFRTTGATSTSGRAGVMLSWRTDFNYAIAVDDTAERPLSFYYKGSLPLSYNDLGKKFMSIPNNTRRVRFHDNTDDTKIGEFDVSAIAGNTTRTYTLPNASGTLALISDINNTQTYSALVSRNATLGNFSVSSGLWLEFNMDETYFATKAGYKWNSNVSGAWGNTTQSRYDVLVSGYYNMSFNVTWATSSSASRVLCRLASNSGIFHGGVVQSDEYACSVTVTNVPLVAGDQVIPQVRTANNRNVVGSDQLLTWCSIQLVNFFTDKSAVDI